MSNGAHARILRERLKLANATPRCGAKRRDGGSCRQAAMGNGRCRMHGGKSTGPRTGAQPAGELETRLLFGRGEVRPP